MTTADGQERGLRLRASLSTTAEGQARRPCARVTLQPSCLTESQLAHWASGGSTPHRAPMAACACTVLNSLQRYKGHGLKHAGWLTNVHVQTTLCRSGAGEQALRYVAPSGHWRWSERPRLPWDGWQGGALRHGGAAAAQLAVRAAPGHAGHVQADAGEQREGRAVGARHAARLRGRRGEERAGGRAACMTVTPKPCTVLLSITREKRRAAA
jgi:hypothetical protein